MLSPNSRIERDLSNLTSALAIFVYLVAPKRIGKHHACRNAYPRTAKD